RRPRRGRSPRRDRPCRDRPRWPRGAPRQHCAAAAATRPPGRAGHSAARRPAAAPVPGPSPGPASPPGPATPPPAGRSGQIVIAPDSFKGSIGAADAASALAGGWLSQRPGDQVTCLPLADGGEGTLEVLAAAVPGARWHPVTVTGPGGDPVKAAWLELP